MVTKTLYGRRDILADVEEQTRLDERGFQKNRSKCYTFAAQYSRVKTATVQGGGIPTRGNATSSHAGE